MSDTQRSSIKIREVNNDATTVPKPKVTLADPVAAAISFLRAGDTTIDGFQREDVRWFAKSTRADIFDVKDGFGNLYRDLNDEELQVHLQSDALNYGRRLRIIFLDGDENDSERLPITRSTLQSVHTTYDITPRFAFYLSRQQQASSSTHHDKVTGQPRRLEYWYSAVIRSQALHTPDPTRRIMNWLRCCIWGDFDAASGRSTILAMRYPQSMKEAFFGDFEGARAVALEQHPLLIHALWMERLGTHQRDINPWFNEPIYEMENDLVDLKGPADLFESTRAITKVYRQVKQVLTDYEIFLASTKCMRAQCERASNLMNAHTLAAFPTPSVELQQQLDNNFQQIEKELELGKAYLTLYLEKCYASITHSNLISTKHSAQLQIQTLKELNNVSRDSREDNQSLRNIQIMTAIFLPPSLISSIFGMNFFNTARADNGDSTAPVVFSVASHWWWYCALTVPITVVLLIVICWEYVAWNPREKKIYWRRRRRPSSAGSMDLEAGALHFARRLPLPSDSMMPSNAGVEPSYAIAAAAAAAGEMKVSLTSSVKEVDPFEKAFTVGRTCA